jgi:hypothetical protein
VTNPAWIFRNGIVSVPPDLDYNLYFFIHEKNHVMHQNVLNMPIMFSIHGILRISYNPLLWIRIRVNPDPDGQK